MQEYSERASIVMWLRSQEQALAIWIDEILARAPEDAELIERLDRHRGWLATAISELSTRRVA